MYPIYQSEKNRILIAFLSLIMTAFLPGIAIAQTPIFYNEGALFHATPGAFMIVKNASMQNDYGNIDNGGTIEVEGHFINNDQASGADTTGVYDIHGNWENNQDFDADKSTVNLIGGNELLTGTSVTTFYNLSLLGTGIKTQTIDQEVTHELRLNDRELATELNTMHVTNTDTGAITRSTGFVSSLGAGSLARNTNSTNSYLFPVGSSVGTPRYRPVRMAPNNGTSNTYSVRLANTEATNEGFDISVKEDSLCFLNPNFYHRINHTAGASPVDISIYFDILSDGYYDRIGHWQNVPEWQSTGAASLNNAGVGLSKITKTGWNDFSYTPFALAHMNPTVEIVGDSGFCKSSTVLLSTNTTSVGDLDYQWRKNGAAAPGSANDSVYAAFQVGDYTVEVTDSNSCSATSALKNIVVFQLPSVTVTGEGVVCSGDTVGWFADATPGSGPITIYQWKRNNNPVGMNSPYYTPSQDGNYSVEVTDINGCTVLETKRLLEIPAPQVIITGDDFLCDTLELTAFASAGSGASITGYQWILNGINLAGANNATYNSTLGGNYTVEVTSSNGCATASPIKTVTDTCANDSCVTQSIQIEPGWNMISSYISPDSPDMLDVISNITSEVLIIKNGAGQAAIPVFGINSIGDWEVEAGYKLKSSDPTVLTLGCTQVDPTTTPIYLPQGWSLISYLRTSPMNVMTALAGVTSSNILIVKNVTGASYIPSFGINTIGDMLPGQGYSIKMANADTLYYPANPKNSTGGFYQQTLRPAHYRVDKNTGYNATIIVPKGSLENIDYGDEIGVYDKDGNLAGSAVYEDRHLAITVWGDDPTTEKIDGMVLGDEFIYKIWRSATQYETTATVQYAQGETAYQDGGVSILKKAETTGTSSIFNFSIYPNPTNDQVHVAFYTPEEEMTSVTLFDIRGKELLKKESKSVPGNNEVIFDLSSFAAGTYMIDFKSNSLSRISKIEKY